uniref:Phosphate/phosphite/phosphonate ABC transporter substrate-binding protein n=1 Tax=Desulfatirhabdium butyrativorans TaxID=340467 RepID=A0A7C4MLM1_9BACT
MNASCIFPAIIRLIIAFLMISASACDRDKEYTSVDFRTKSVKPPAKTQDTAEPILQIAVAAMISPKETLVYYRELIDYLGSKLNRNTLLIQRKTYGEINDLLSKNQIDIAFICSGPYVLNGNPSGFQAIATPIIRGSPLYQAYLIVHNDSPFQKLEDLKGRSFAFTDPHSNTGFIVPRYWLSLMNTNPETFFGSTIFTFSHDNAIMAVAKHLVDAASVDSLYWEYYQTRNPYYSAKTRVIQKSEGFGSPPIVVSNALSKDVIESLTHILLTMHQDLEGQRILSGLLVDRFESPKTEWYDPIRNMVERLSLKESRDAYGTR